MIVETKPKKNKRYKQSKSIAEQNRTEHYKGYNGPMTTSLLCTMDFNFDIPTHYLVGSTFDYCITISTQAFLTTTVYIDQLPNDFYDFANCHHH